MLQHRFKYLAVAGLAATALSVQPALAQKTKDIMRFGINDPFSSLDSYHVPHEETGLFTRVMYGVQYRALQAGVARQKGRRYRAL